MRVHSNKDEACTCVLSVLWYNTINIWGYSSLQVMASVREVYHDLLKMKDQVKRNDKKNFRYYVGI